jgi:chromosome partitioning protein
MTQIVALLNQKGGVGKTTLTINLGAALGHLGSKVLLVDLDPQGHLTEGVGMQECYLEEEGATLFDCLVGKEPPALSTLIRQHPTEPFAVIPSSFEMMLAEQQLFMARNREHRLRALFSQLDNRFDWVLIDCPPALSNLTDNALNAARQVIIPIQPEPASVRALDLLFDQIESLERGLNIHVNVLAIVPNQVQDSALSKRILGELREKLPRAVTPFDFRKRVLLQEAWDKGTSIFAYPGESTAQRQTRDEIADLYRQLAEFIVARAEGRNDG